MTGRSRLAALWSGPWRTAVVVALGVAVALLGAVAWRQKHGGIWRTHPERSDAAPAPIPYVNWVPVSAKDRGKAGTTLHDKKRAYRGYNLYVRKPDAVALLVDMDGEVVHRWSSRVGQPPRGTRTLNWRGWQLARMLPNGDLLAVVPRRALLKLDFRSHVVWKTDLPIHHDVAVGRDGTIYALVQAPRQVEIDGRKRTILDEGWAVLTPDGKEKERVWFSDVFLKDEGLARMLSDVARRRAKALDRVGLAKLIARRVASSEDGELGGDTKLGPDDVARLTRLVDNGTWDGDTFDALVLLRLVPTNPFDVLHLNAVFPLDTDVAGLGKAGDLLFSFRSHDLLLVVGGADHRPGWRWGPGELLGQHNPSVLADGKVLVFDNGNNPNEPGKRDHSRLVEVDPVTKKITWSYEASSPRDFFAPAEGGCQGLPNGDVLVADEAGRAFEVSRDKEIVWEYYNPRFDETGKRRAGLYRIERIAPDIVEPLLGGSGSRLHDAP
ncbi:MAG TPA: arylsulfotransferase family protein [Minicystis sp.]|nr:arylsulfotransferase family protein [Minicystis sp.]